MIEMEQKNYGKSHEDLYEALAPHVNRTLRLSGQLDPTEFPQNFYFDFSFVLESVFLRSTPGHRSFRLQPRGESISDLVGCLIHNYSTLKFELWSDNGEWITVYEPRGWLSYEQWREFKIK